MYELQVEGMSCGHCVGRVTKSVQSLDDSAKVDVDLKSNTVRVSTDVDLALVKSAIEEAGYPVTSTSTR
jgi:copper ion binding protein